MARRVDDLQGKVRIGAKGEFRPVVKEFRALQRDRRSPFRRKVHLRVQQVPVRAAEGKDRDIERSPDVVRIGDVVKVPVGQKDLLDDPPVLPDQLQQLFRLRAGIDQETVPVLIVDIEKAVHVKVLVQCYR